MLFLDVNNGYASRNRITRDNRKNLNPRIFLLTVEEYTFEVLLYQLKGKQMFTH